MAENESSTSSAVDRLTYLLIGAGIGATVALLFAPKSGRELRGDIADASRKSIEWCLKGVENCWSQKERFLKGDEIEQGREAYDHARKTYTRLLAEAQQD